MSTLRTNAIIDASGGNTATINGIPLRQGVLDPENRIINGSFDFWQRGTSTSAIGYGAADRWYNGGTVGTVTMSRQSFSVGDTLGSNNPTYFMRQTVSGQTLASQGALPIHRIESVRSYAGQTITVLGWARRSSGSGNMAVEAVQVFGTGGSPSSDVLGISPTTIALSGSWTPFAAVMAIPPVTGKTIGTNGNDYLGLNFWTSAGSDFNARTNSLGLQTLSVDLWGIHIKLGTHTADATALYKQPELGPELARCQRYYSKTSNIDVVPVNGAAGGTAGMFMSGVVNFYSTGNGYFEHLSFPQPMRGTPSIQLFRTGAATGTDGNPSLYSAATGWVTATSWGLNNQTAYGFSVFCAYPNLPQGAQLYSTAFTADAEL